MQKLIAIASVSIIVSCQSKSDPYQESNHLLCSNSRIQDEYIIHWKDSKTTKKKISDLRSYLKNQGHHILLIEPNYKLQIESHLNSQTLQSNNQSFNLYERIGATSAWEKGHFGKNILIAIIDSGVSIHDPSLQANLFTNWNDATDDEVDNDQNGYIDDRHGWNFSLNSNQVIDEVGHGSAITSVITGSSGLAKDSRFLPLDIMSDDTGSEYDAKKAVDYAIQMKVQIINNSWSMTCSVYLANSFREYESSNVIFVNAAGNSSTDVFKTNMMLSSLVLSNFVNVGSLTNSLIPSEFSGFGQSVNMWTYGENIPVLSINHSSRNITTSGTSLSAALVSGAIALIWSAYPQEKAYEIIDRLNRSSEIKNGKRHLSIQNAFN